MVKNGIISQMGKINNIKLKTLEQTKNFYIWELKRKESLTGNERSKYITALESINKIIREKERPIIKKEKPQKQYFTRRGY